MSTSTLESSDVLLDALRTRCSGKFLTFFLGAEEYGIEIHKVSEIISAMPITRLPGTPDYIQGLINLRGQVIPVMHLRARLELTSATDESCIVVIRGNVRVMGVIVDRVSEVVTVRSENVDRVPDFGSGIDSGCLLGVDRAGGRVRLLLDIDRVIGSTERP